jgi:hypothetical protein
LKTSVILLLLLTFLSGCKSQVGAGEDLVTLTIGGKEIYVEVVETYEKRQQGLMFRDKLEEDHGMLFVFPDEAHLSFWMKDTKIPLSIAFIKADGWIAQIESMEPNSLKTHNSETRVRYALEMNDGWFKENNIRVGDKIKIPSSLEQSP